MVLCVRSRAVVLCVVSGGGTCNREGCHAPMWSPTSCEGHGNEQIIISVGVVEETGDLPLRGGPHIVVEFHSHGRPFPPHTEHIVGAEWRLGS